MPKYAYIILFLAIGYGIFHLLMVAKAPTEGDSVNFQAELTDGSSFELADLKGKYVVLDFWGSWCRPCRVENPKLVAMHNKYKDKSFTNAKGFEVVTVALEKDMRTWERAAERDGFVWKHQIVQTAQFVVMSSLAQQFGVSEIPAKFLIDPEGKIVNIENGFAGMDAYLAERVE